MTQHSNKTYHYVVTAIAVLVFITPLSSSAEGKILDTKLCVELPQFRVRLDKAIDDRGNKVLAMKADRLKSLSAAWEKEVDSKEQDRHDADEKRLAHFAVLKSKAKTDAEKVTIDAFQKSVELAVDTRRDAIDQAFADYKDGVSAMLGTKIKKIDDLRNSYGTTVKSAFTEANSSCTKGLTRPAIREKIKSTLQGLESNYQTNKGSILNVEADMRALAKTRREKIESAEAIFKQSIEKASAQFSL